MFLGLFFCTKGKGGGCKRDEGNSCPTFLVCSFFFILMERAMTALKPKLPADAQNRQCHHKVLPHFPGRRRQLKCTLSMHPTSTEGTQNSLTREGGCLGGLAHGPYDHYLGKITIKHCLAMGKSIGKVRSVTLYTEVHHIFAFLRVTSKSLPQTASDLHLPFFLCGESCPSPSAQDSGL